MYKTRASVLVMQNHEGLNSKVVPYTVTRSLGGALPLTYYVEPPIIIYVRVTNLKFP